MIASVRESKARLSELIAKATAGEEVLITVRGKPAVRLTPVSPRESEPDVKAWAERRREKLRRMPESSDSSTDILSALREERF
jgi:prevent-host-death family protein